MALEQETGQHGDTPRLKPSDSLETEEGWHQPVPEPHDGQAEKQGESEYQRHEGEEKGKNCPDGCSDLCHRNYSDESVAFLSLKRLRLPSFSISL